MKSKGLERLLKATGYTIKGLRAAWDNEEAFRQEVIVLLFVIPLGLWVGGTPVQKGLFVFVWLVVMMVELINSSIEAIVDRIGYEKHELSGRAKDMGSAAVFISICASIIVWLAIIYDRITKSGY